MKKLLQFALAAIAFVVTSHARAEPFYGVGGSLLSFDDEIEPKNVFFRLGTSINEYVEIGAEISITLLSDEIDVDVGLAEPIDIDFDIDTTFLFLKLNAPLDNGARLYAMIGPSDVEVTGSSRGVSVSVDDSDTGIGFGIEVPLQSGGRFSLDYIRYFNDDGVDLTGINFGYSARF